MADYTLAVGTRDPLSLQAASDPDALEAAARLARERFTDDLRRNPQEVATLLGPSGLVSAPGERLDVFVTHADSGIDTPETVTPGQTDAPDCNGA